MNLQINVILKQLNGRFVQNIVANNEVKFETENESRRAENESHQCRERYHDVIFWKTIINCEREKSAMESSRISFNSTTRRGHIVGKLFIYEILDALKITGSPAISSNVVLHRKLSHLTSPTLEIALRILAWLLDGEIVFRVWVQSVEMKYCRTSGGESIWGGIVFLLSNCIKAVADRSYAKKRRLMDSAILKSR